MSAGQATCMTCVNSVFSSVYIVAPSGSPSKVFSAYIFCYYIWFGTLFFFINFGYLVIFKQL